MAPEPADPAEPNHRRLSPKKPHSAKSAKLVCQTNPIPAASDNAIAPASDNALALATGRPPPQKPHTAQSAEIELPNRPNLAGPI